MFVSVCGEPETIVWSETKCRVYPNRKLIIPAVINSIPSGNFATPVGIYGSKYREKSC